MDTDPNAPETIDDRSPADASAPKPRERYNTEYIVDNFSRLERRNRLIVAGLALALVLSLGLGLVLNSRNHPTPPPVASDAPAEGTAPAGAAH